MRVNSSILPMPIRKFVNVVMLLSSLMSLLKFQGSLPAFVVNIIVNNQPQVVANIINMAQQLPDLEKYRFATSE